MKNFKLYAVLSIVFLVTFAGSCDNSVSTAKIKRKVKTVVISGHTYLKYDESDSESGYGFMAHSGNCPTCQALAAKRHLEILTAIKATK